MNDGRIRLVLDTSSLVRAALDPRSAAARLLDALRTDATILASRATLAELVAVLERPKFASRLPEAERRLFLEAFAAVVELVEPAISVTDCRDPDDDKFLELAVEGGATVIVTDDRDLLTLDPWRGIRIQKPEAALADLVND